MTNEDPVAVPNHIWQHLPEYDAGAPFAALTDGRFLIAGDHALFLVGEDGIEDSGMWYQVQYASWAAETRKLRVLWVDPGAQPLNLVTVDENPDQFMRVLTSRVDRAIVSSKQLRLPSGITVTVTVRRRADGQLFSSVLADGDIQVADEPYLDAFEEAVLAELGLTD